MIRDSVEECLPHKDPLERPDYTEAEIQAVRALRRGEASARQQVMALEWLIRAAGTHDTSFRPDGNNLTAFAEGKRFVGTTVVWMLNVADSKTDPDKIAARKVDPNDRADNR
jgi:hypothetical protein